MDYFGKSIENAMGDAFVKVPYNVCPRIVAKIDFNITPKSFEKIIYENELMVLINDLLMGAVNGISKRAIGRWEFFHPMFIYNPEEKMFTVKFFAKEKEKDEPITDTAPPH